MRHICWTYGRNLLRRRLQKANRYIMAPSIPIAEKSMEMWRGYNL